MSPRVLVTGGAGFVGSHLVDRLRDDGDEVVVLDNFTTGARRNLSGRLADVGLEIIDGTVLDAHLVDRLVESSSLVFHLAAAVGVTHIVSNPVESVLTNVRGAEHVLAAAHRYGRRVVLASTSEIYGQSTAVPFREDGDRVLGPTWVHRWSYSTAKAIDEHLAFAYADRGLAMSIVRYFNSYGPRIDESGYGSVVARFVAQALRGEPMTVHGDGEQSRCFTFVSDTVRGTILAARTSGAIGSVFNIGNPRETTIRELAELIRGITNSKSAISLVPYESAYPRGFADTRRRAPDVSRATEQLGFTAEVSLEEGLGLTVDWCRLNYGIE